MITFANAREECPEPQNFQRQSRHLKDDSLAVAACELVAATVRTFGSMRLPLSGTSMTPALLPGDAIIIHKIDLREMAPGEIAIFSRGGRVIAHRVLFSIESSGELKLITRGDRVSSTDGPVSSGELIGRVECVERGGLRFAPPRRLKIRYRLIAPVLRASDWAAYAYVRLAKSIVAVRRQCQA